MKLRFVLASKAFKSGAGSLFLDYVNRISRFLPCQVGPASDGKAGTKIWVCDRGADAKMLSSEEVAEALGELMNSGTKELQIVIGSAEGFSEKELAEWNPDLKWSFGPLTLPHELAAVVAAEQIYRALTILKRLPYHAAH